jgi:hypothetical protein
LEFCVEDVLPSEVLTALENHFLAGVKRAESTYDLHQADEDSVTGALGQALAELGQTRMFLGGRTFAWRSSYRKCRGRGKGAPEKQLGADGMFELSVIDEFGQPIRRKGLLFQAKNQWRGSDPRLAAQAERLGGSYPGSVVIDYSPKGFAAFDAKDVSRLEGKRTQVRPIRRGGLGAVLAFEFAHCRRGTVGMWFDGESEQVLQEHSVAPPRLIVESVIVTELRTGFA